MDEYEQTAAEKKQEQEFFMEVQENDKKMVCTCFSSSVTATPSFSLSQRLFSLSRCTYAVLCFVCRRHLFTPLSFHFAQDQLLDVIGAGLKELKEIATDIGTVPMI